MNFLLIPGFLVAAVFAASLRQELRNVPSRVYCNSVMYMYILTISTGMQKKLVSVWAERCLWCSTISTLLNSGSQVCVDAFCRRSARFQALQESVQILVAKFCGVHSRGLQQLCSRHECPVDPRLLFSEQLYKQITIDVHACSWKAGQSTSTYGYTGSMHVFLSSHCAGSARRRRLLGVHSPPKQHFYCIVLHLRICIVYPCTNLIKILNTVFILSDYDTSVSVLKIAIGFLSATNMPIFGLFLLGAMFPWVNWKVQ